MFQYISCYSLSCGKDLFKWESWEFQYISCYSLSTTEIAEMAIDLFQYISCYSLSWKLQKYIIQTYMFQYISCYSLSILLTATASPSCVSIHLMLLFIKFFRLSVRLENSFNTSHVTLYPSFYRLFFF